MVASVFIGDVGVIGCTSKMIVPIKQLWLCVSVCDFLISQIVIIWDTYALLLCFHTQHTNSLLLLIHVQVQCDLVITRNTCVDVYSINCHNLFLKYKIGLTCLVCMCMCMCVGSWMLFFFFFWLLLLRDVFESLTCWLDVCLNSLLVAFISMCFSTLWKTHFLQARQLLDRFLSIEPLRLPFLTKVNAISIHWAFWNSSR